TILANWYWHYFQNNRWRFMQRTQTAQPPGKDFTTWDLPRLFAQIDTQFQKALANVDTLKKTPISAFDDLLVEGNLPDIYRPTLYDFIAHEALNFYSSGEQAAAKSEDAFELPADSPIFDSAEKFIAWRAGEASAPAQGRYEGQSYSQDSAILRASRLYQDLLKLHQNDKVRSAFIEVDIARLAYGYNVAFGEQRNVRYKAALKALVDTWADHELSTLALHNWARVLQSEEDLVEARNLALRGATLFPNSPGGKLCRTPVSEIEAKS